MATSEPLGPFSLVVTKANVILVITVASAADAGPGLQLVHSKVTQHILYATLALFLFAKRPHNAISGFDAEARTKYWLIIYQENVICDTANCKIGQSMVDL